jgi:hypothetical protein
MALIFKLSKNSSIQAAAADHPPRKRPVSERKIQANRKNARRSTGPRTERGKRTASRNAIKLGFFARDVVLRTERGEESLEEFQTLLGRLYESYKPVGVAEELLVQTIANCWWRNARVSRAENGEIQKQLDSFAYDQAQQALGAAKQSILELEASYPAELFAKLPAVDIVDLCESAKSDLRKHSIGRSYLARLLQEAKIEIIDDGYLSNTTAARLFLLFDLWDHPFARTCLLSASSSAGEAETAASVDNRDDEATNKGVPPLKAICAQIEMMELFEKRGQERDTLAKTRCLSLPPADVIDKLLRYEAHLDRQLYRAMDRLERLQRQRRGECVPAPAVVDVSVHASASSLPEALEKFAGTEMAKSVPALEQTKSLSGGVDGDVHAVAGIVDSVAKVMEQPKKLPGEQE